MSVPVNKIHELEKLHGRYIGALIRGDYILGATSVLAADALVDDDKSLFNQLFKLRLKEYKNHKELLLGNSCSIQHSLSLNQ